MPGKSQKSRADAKPEPDLEWLNQPGAIYEAPRHLPPTAPFLQMWLVDLHRAQLQLRRDLSSNRLAQPDQMPDLRWLDRHRQKREELRRAALWEIASVGLEDEFVPLVDLVGETHQTVLKEACLCATRGIPWENSAAQPIFDKAMGMALEGLPLLAGKLHPNGPITIQTPEGLEFWYKDGHPALEAGEGSAEPAEERRPDGPQRPNQFHWQGQTYLMQPLDNKLLAWLWSRREPHSFQIIEDAVWGHDEAVGDTAVRSAIQRVNGVMDEAGCPYRIRTKNHTATLWTET